MAAVSNLFVSSKQHILHAYMHTYPKPPGAGAGEKVNGTGTPSMVDLFCGCGGLSEGFRQAGFNIVTANDNWKNATETYEANHGLRPILGSIADAVTYDKMVEAAKGVDVVAGGPPCQAFSTAGRRLSVKDPRGNLVLEFIRFIDDVRPKAFVMENVRGILSAAISHRPLSQRGNGTPLSKDEELGSALKLILSEFDRIGYTVNYGLLNAADYGVPQKRERVFFIGSRDGDVVPLPERTHYQAPSNGGNVWVPLAAALNEANGCDDPDSGDICTAYAPERGAVFEMVPPGGNWRSLPQGLQQQVMGGAYNSSGGRVGFFRRLSQDEPAPTLVTSPLQKATAMCHPFETRPLSVKEYAAIQQFPKWWVYKGSTSDKYRLIGNAVPVGLAKAVAVPVKAYLTSSG